MIRKLARSIRENIWAALLSPLCMVGEVYMEVRIPGIITKIVDMGIKPGDNRYVINELGVGYRMLDVQE